MNRQVCTFTIPMPEDADEQELQPPAITRLTEIRVPTLILVGELDLVGKLELAEQLAKSIPSARRVIIRDADHMVSMEQPQEFNRIVLEFLREPRSTG